MNSTAENNFVETLEYRRFAEFCDACRHCRYNGLCYGSPRVGKTLSARRYSLWDRIQGVKLRDLPDGQRQELARVEALLYTKLRLALGAMGRKETVVRDLCHELRISSRTCPI